MAHLEGRTGLGIVPIRDDGTCVFGAIDIDVYDIDLREFEIRVKVSGLPLTVCRTKSGGIHLYLFLSEPVPAKLIREKLASWAAHLGFPRSEIFPKQDALRGPDDSGSWINLPYFAGDRTTRYAIVSGSPLTLDEFLTHAESVRISGSALKKAGPIIDEDLVGAPPCVQGLTNQGIPTGSRNEILFALAVYARKRFGESWEEALERFNEKYFDPPLSAREVATIAKSVDKKEYGYPCKHAQLSAFCDRNVCLQREFGVAGAINDPGVQIENLVKILTDPPSWTIVVNGQRIKLEETEDLLSQRRFNLLVVERTNILPRMVKVNVWENIVQRLLDSVTEMTAPSNASRRGQFLELVEYFLTERPKARNREEILLGKCFLEEDTVYFRSSDLIKFLEIGRFKIDAREAWSILREKEAVAKRMKIKGKTVRVWGMVIDGTDPSIEPGTENSKF
jgi:hypothetical protein